MAASLGGEVPGGERTHARVDVGCATSTSVAISARRNCEFWNEPIGCPNAVRCLTYSSVQVSAARAAATAATAMDSRSCGQVRDEIGEALALLAQQVRRRAPGHR